MFGSRSRRRTRAARLAMLAVAALVSCLLTDPPCVGSRHRQHLRGRDRTRWGAPPRASRWTSTCSPASSIQPVGSRHRRDRSVRHPESARWRLQGALRLRQRQQPVRPGVLRRRLRRGVGGFGARRGRGHGHRHRRRAGRGCQHLRTVHHPGGRRCRRGWGERRPRAGGRSVSAVLRSDPTDSDGFYVVQGLPPGTYRLSFTDIPSGVGEFWNDKATVEAADLIVLRVGQALTGFDAVLGITPPPLPAIVNTQLPRSWLAPLLRRSATRCRLSTGSWTPSQRRGERPVAGRRPADPGSLLWRSTSRPSPTSARPSPSTSPPRNRDTPPRR